MSRTAPPLLPIFRSENQMRLLGQLFLQPDVEYTVGELESATSIPQQTISRELARLVQAGLVRDRRQGRMHFVAANQASLYFPELARLLLKALRPKEVLADEFAGVPGINEAYIFGSWARRYDGLPGDPPRDVDVVVIAIRTSTRFRSCGAAPMWSRQRRY